MKIYRDEVIRVAAGEIGYLEKASNADLDSKPEIQEPATGPGADPEESGGGRRNRSADVWKKTEGILMNLITRYITRNPYFNDGLWISGDEFKGFFLHDVACAQPDPEVFANGWDNESHDAAGINGFIGDQKVVITAPCLETPGRVKRMPHACRPANDHYIGFEMTNPATLKYNENHTKCWAEEKDLPAARAFVAAQYQNAVELFAVLCVFHGKDPLADGVILSHKEGGQRGIASQHGDPDGLWNGLNMGYTMDGFRSDVAKRVASISVIPEPEQPEESGGYLGFPDVSESDWYAGSLAWLVEHKVVHQSGKPYRPDEPLDKATATVLLARFGKQILAEREASSQPP